MKIQRHAFFAVATLVFIQCPDAKANELDKGDEGKYLVQALTSPENGKTFRADTVKTMTFSWKAPEISGNYEYKVVIDRPDGNFSSPLMEISAGNRLQVRILREDLDKALETAGIKEGEYGNLKWAVSLLTEDGQEIVSETSHTMNVKRMIYYSNPVWSTNRADPSVIRAADGYFYVYSTSRMVARGRSKDLINWENLLAAFTEETRPDYVEGGGCWAPDVEYINGIYVMYGTQTVAMAGGNPNSSIWVATSPSPDGTFKDFDRLFTAAEAGLAGGAVDEFFFEDNGKKYLFFGSFRGIFGYELSDDGLSIVTPDKNSGKIQIAGDGYEGGMLFKRGKYYYLFASIGSCCSGLNSTYKLVVGRSENLFGPYVNKKGEKMMNNKHEVLLKGLKKDNDRFVGPGHCSELFTDSNGDVWILYHSYDQKKLNSSGDAVGRLLMLDKLTFDEEGWPSFGGRTPNVPSVKSAAPVFLDQLQ